MRHVLVLPLMVALASCGGDDASSVVDAAVGDASGGDAAVGDCYRELADLANATTPEPTGLVVGGPTTAICGTVATDHPGPAELDRDRFELTMPNPGPVVVRISAPGAAGLARLQLDIESPGGLVTRARVIGGIGVAVAALPAGAHVLTLVATGATSAPIPYRMSIGPDEPAARCPLGVTVPDYVERDEATAGHRANDVVAVHTQPLTTAATPLASDAPEVTARAVSSGGRAVLAGLSADVPPAGDDYHDRDTFAVYTGQTTNFLEIRAAWAAAADLDVYVFEADHPDDPLGSPAAAVVGELVVTAVKPATLYWIWIGGATRSATLPASYTMAVCGAELTPAAP
ncbi:MAG: hypothetical protein IPL61_14960 [Myxococcales bacterium]|nr:hypothetical protein [Myxococcales bacterium]